MNHVLLITGSPGVGKTTILTRVVDILRKRGYSIGGMLAREVRDGRTRIGFEILDLGSPRRGWLARVDNQSGPHIGRYRVNVVDLETVGTEAILNAINDCDIVAIDEIGPMELFSEKFRNAVRAALESTNIVIAVVHGKARDRLVTEIKGMEGSETFKVTYQNRETLSQVIANKVLQNI